MDNNSTPAKAIDLANIRLSLTSDAGAVEVLRGIDLSIFVGETVGIVGPSGSGKTSLLMVMAGLEPVTGGQVFIDGQSFAGLNEDALARFRREHVGIVFQSFHLVPTMTALENVALPMEFAGKANAFERGEEELRAVGLGERLAHYPGQLSGGEQQRVALARAFVTRPALMLADEPTGSLDGETGNAVMDLLFELQKKLGTTLVLVTHAPDIAAKCSRIIRLADGQIAADAAAKVALA